MQIRDEGRFRPGIVETRREQRLLLDIKRPRRLPLEPGLDTPRVFAPGPELAAEGMQDLLAP
jgi:hypothetical protein